jgi:serine phosphatase RsbU (regulator of sigma subunit)
VQLAARYVPAGNRSIGGDWYDAFTLPSGQLWLVIGDVAGHGLRAAVVMGRVKSALRAYALQGGTPHRVLEETDRKAHHFEVGAIITIVCVTSVPPYDRYQVCLAGHPPPVLAVPGREARFVDVQPGPPLGAKPDVTRTSTPVELPPGAVLLLYTDGLIEHRNEPIDEGLQRLRSAVTPGTPEAVCQTVMRRLIGDRVTTDDVAVLAVGRVGAGDSG